MSRTALLIAAIATAAAASAQVDPDRVVVKVNGAPILGKDYYKRMEVQPGLGSRTNDGGFVQIYPGYLALRWLIEEELIVQLAKSQGVGPTDAEVDTEYKFRLEQNPDQFKGMVQVGLNEQDIKRRILIDMSEFRVLTKGITITDFEVEKYYADNTSKFTLPKRYVLRMVRVAKEEDKKPVDDALARGDKFADVATQFSTDLSKLDGGRIGVFPEEDMVPATRTIISATRKGQTTRWLEQGGAFAKFFVEDILEQQIITLDAPLKKAIREELMAERGQSKNNLPLMVQEFRKKAVLEFGNHPFAAELKRHFELGG